MHDLIKAAILGIVEGITEFLPISSTGHLIIVNQFVAFDEQFTKMFDVVIQLGAILSVIVYFHRKINPLEAGQSREERLQIIELWKKTIVAVFPALVAGAIFHAQIERLFNPITVSIALVIGGVILLYIESRERESRINSLAALNYRTALMIGLIQCLGMIPGTSRSAATIIGAMLLGASRVVASEFSFFLAIPTLLAASVYTLYKSGLNMSPTQLSVLITGFIVSFLVAWVVIAGFMNYIGRRDFKPFAYYRIILGGFILAYFILGRGL